MKIACYWYLSKISILSSSTYETHLLLDILILAANEVDKIMGVDFWQFWVISSKT